MPDSDFMTTWSAIWGTWPRWLARLQAGRVVCIEGEIEHTQQMLTHAKTGRRYLGPWPPGRYVQHIYDPKMPALPRALENTDWAREYDAAAPWTCKLERAWMAGFQGEPCSPGVDEIDRPAYENGRTAGMSKQAKLYRDYLESCRAALGKAGWSDEEIP